MEATMATCNNCGGEILEGTKFCNHCGGAVAQANNAPNTQSTNSKYIESHLAKSIIVTFLCCVPLGIVSIVHAASVGGKVQAGDIEGATIASNKADQWGNWAIGAGVAWWIIWVLFMVILELL